jgi:hypothetical protein
MGEKVPRRRSGTPSTRGAEKSPFPRCSCCDMEIVFFLFSYALDLVRKENIEPNFSGNYLPRASYFTSPPRYLIHIYYKIITYIM